MEQSIIAIKQLLATSVSKNTSPLSDIRKVFFGDPMTIPESDLPALAIQPISTDYTMRGSRYDEKLQNIEIRLVYNAKAYFGQSALENDNVFAVEDAIRKVEMSNANQGTDAYTICGTIQKNQTLPYKSGTQDLKACEIAQVTNVNYSLSTSRGFPTYEVTVTIKVQVIGDR